MLAMIKYPETETAIGAIHPKQAEICISRCDVHAFCGKLPCMECCIRQHRQPAYRIAHTDSYPTRQKDWDRTTPVLPCPAGLFASWLPLLIPMNPVLPGTTSPVRTIPIRLLMMLLLPQMVGIVLFAIRLLPCPVLFIVRLILLPIFWSGLAGGSAV